MKKANVSPSKKPSLDTQDRVDDHAITRPTLIASPIHCRLSPIPDLSPEAKQDHRLIARPTAGQRLRVRRQSMRQVAAALLDRLLRRPRSCEASRWRARPRNPGALGGGGADMEADGGRRGESALPSSKIISRSSFFLTICRATVIRRIISALFSHWS